MPWRSGVSYPAPLTPGVLVTLPSHLCGPSDLSPNEQGKHVKPVSVLRRTHPADLCPRPAQRHWLPPARPSFRAWGGAIGAPPGPELVLPRLEGPPLPGEGVSGEARPPHRHLPGPAARTQLCEGREAREGEAGWGGGAGTIVPWCVLRGPFSSCRGSCFLGSSWPRGSPLGVMSRKGSGLRVLLLGPDELKVWGGPAVRFRGAGRGGGPTGPILPAHGPPPLSAALGGHGERGLTE